MWSPQQKRRFAASLMICMLGELIVAHPLLAATACAVRRSTLDERFGLLPVGANIKDSANNGRLKPCPSTTGQCVYTDEIGIEYDSDDDHVAIAGKGFDLSIGKEGKFPLGLTPQDSIADFMRKILPEDDVEASIFKSGDKILLLSAPCHANSMGIVFQILAVFTGEGRLAGVSIVNSSGVQKMLEFRNELSRRNK